MEMVTGFFQAKKYRILAGMAVIFLGVSSVRGAVVFNTLESLFGPPYFSSPQGALVSQPAGINFPLAGVFSVGGPVSGANGRTNGGIFSMSAVPFGFTSYYYPGAFTNLHYFNAAEGGIPLASPVNGADNTLYGTTSKFALTNQFFPGGMGSIYKMTTDSTLTVLYRFGSVTNSSGQPVDGASPTISLVAMSDGNYYGATYFGGTNGYAGGGSGYGTLFRVTTNGVLTTLHQFKGTDGAHPNGLIRGNNNLLFGTTAFGGTRTTVADYAGDDGFGTVFQLGTDGTFSTIYSFDLCRLACSIFDFMVDDIKYVKKCAKDPVKKIIIDWCLDDKGVNVLYKNDGTDRYPDFKLYKMIARFVHNHTPQAQFERPEFKAYEFTGEVKGDIMDIDIHF